MTATDNGHATPEAVTNSDGPDPCVDLRARTPVLERVVDVAATVVDECIVRFEDDRLRIAATDPALVALVDVTLEAAACETYRVREPTTVGLDLERLADCLGMAGTDDVVGLRLDDETGTLGIELEDLAYATGVLDPETVREPPDVGDLEAPTTAAGDDLDEPGRTTGRGCRFRRLDRSRSATPLTKVHTSERPVGLFRRLPVEVDNLNMRT